MILEREARQITGGEKPTYWGYQLLGQGIRRGKNRSDILLAATTEEILGGITDSLKKRSIRLEKLTTDAALLSTALRNPRISPVPREAFLWADETSAHLVFNDQHGFLFEHRIDISPSACAGRSREEVISLESNRTIRYLSQQFRTFSVRRAYGVDEVQSPEVTLSQFPSISGSELDLFDVGQFLTTHVPGIEDAHPAYGRLGLMAVCRESLLDLTPLARQSPRLFSQTQAVAAAAVVLVVSFIYTGALYNTQLDQTRELDRQSEILAGLQPELAQIASLTQFRKAHRERLSLLEQANLQKRAWSEVLRGLSLAVSEEVLFESVEIVSDELIWRIVIKGTSSSGDPERALKAFQAFYEAISELPFIEESSHSELMLESEEARYHRVKFEIYAKLI